MIVFESDFIVIKRNLEYTHLVYSIDLYRNFFGPKNIFCPIVTKFYL